MAHDNAAIFLQGMKSIQNQLHHQQLKMMQNIALSLLHDAVEVWDIENNYNNMTGNTRYSFIAGVYYNQKLVSHYTTWDVAQSTGELGDGPTAGYSFPGDTIWFYNGNKTLYELEGRNDDYGDAIDKSTIRRYRKPFKFQRATKGGSGPKDAAELLREAANETQPTGFSILIGVGVPYAEYLKDVRNLHVLVDTKDNTQLIADTIINSTKKI